MNRRLSTLTLMLTTAWLVSTCAPTASARPKKKTKPSANVQLGPRPHYLLSQLGPGHLRDRLQACSEDRNRASAFSIGHRGAPLQFPEHTKEGYLAAARMGAGILECDVTFTSDGELVCRHSECDLHTTTDMLLDDNLAAKCSVPPRVVNGELMNAGAIRCCTSDITAAEFKTLRGKMDARNASATTVEGYLGGTANFRTDLYATGATLLTHAESIELFDDLGVGMTPELKEGNAANIQAVFGGQDAYAQKMIDEYKAAGIDPRRVWAQSFSLDDVAYWIDNEPAFGKQAVWLDGRFGTPGFDPEDPSTWTSPTPHELLVVGVNIVAPPMPVLLKVDHKGEIAPSRYARHHRWLGFDFITWTLERSGRIESDVLPNPNDFYYATTRAALENDGDIYVTLDVLARHVGILGIFSDWPATVTYYANCMGLD